MKTNHSFIRHSLALLLAMTCLLSCQKSPSLSPSPIMFRSHSDFSASVQTKATVVDETSLNASGFHVSASTGGAGQEAEAWTNVTFNKDGEYFRGVENKWWPSSNPNYHFYACSRELSLTADGATVAATNDYDVVCAYLPTPTYNKVNTLSFNHIFARITDVTFTAVDGYTISGISVTITPDTGGTYNLRTGNDMTDGTGWSNRTTGSPTAIADETPGTKENDLYLVPGSYTITATWTASKGDYTETFRDKTCNVNIVGGAANIITAQLTGDATEITFEIEVTEWGENPINLGKDALLH